MRTLWIAGAALAFCVGIGAVGTHAQQGQPAKTTTPAKAAAGTEIDLTGTSINVATPGTPVKIRIIRWSTDDERTPLLTALTAPPQAPARGGERAGGRGARAGAGGDAAQGRGARPGAAGDAAQGRGAPAAAAGDAQAPNGGAAGRAAGAPQAGRAGRGGARGALVERRPPTPIEALADAIHKAPTVGYIWTNDVTGYSIKYAWHAPIAGGERIILATDRRLGMYSPAWKLASATPATDYDFTVIEIHLDGRGIGEAKTSLTTKVVVDNDAKTLAIDNYAGTPVLLQNIRHYTPKSTE